MDITRISHSIYFYPAILAVATLMGTSFYFLLTSEPNLNVLYGLSIICIITCLIFLKKHHYLKYILFITIFILSATTAGWKTQNIDAKFLNERYEGQRFWVVGQVVDLSSSSTRDKVIIDDVKIYGIDEPLNKIKISTHRGKFSEFKVSDFIALEAVLYKPKNPSFKGDFNAKKRSFFQGISATGYVMGDIYKTSWQSEEAPKGYKWQRFRDTLTKRISGNPENADEHISQEKAVIAALLTGERGAINKETFEVFRKSGLAHLLAISGLHIGMIGGFTFLLVRILYSKIVPYKFIRYNKKVAAITAIVAGIFYTLLAGATLPTTRACVMLSLIFLAILAERNHVTLRILYITLAGILFVSPESVMTASFQLSFCAVTALVLWNTFSENTIIKMDKSSIFGKTNVYVKSIFMTSLIAGLATMPAAAYHFHEITLAGFLLNILAIPLTAFVIMPLGFLSLLTMPIYGDFLFLPAMEFGAGLLLEIAELSDNLGALQFTLSTTEALLLVVPIVLLMLSCILKSLRTLFISVIVSTIGFLILEFFIKNDAKIIVAESHLILENTSKDSVIMHKPARSRNTRYILSRIGLSDDLIKNRMRKDENCDFSGCIYSVNGKNIYVVDDKNASISEEDCSLNDVIFTKNMSFTPAECSAILLNLSHNGSFFFKNMQFVPYESSKNRVWED